VSVRPPRATPFSAQPGKLPIVHSTQDPDTAWRELFLLQKIAHTLPCVTPAQNATADGATAPTPAPLAPPQPRMAGGTDEEREAALKADAGLCALLQSVSLPLAHWGTLLFGLADVRTLQLLEALPRAQEAAKYSFAEVCAHGLTSAICHLVRWAFIRTVSSKSVPRLRISTA
jgi:hypothetical protein